MRNVFSPVRRIIADDEPFICGMLEKLIDFDTLGLELLECVHDGETLEARIEELHPDIVLTDISMPRQDGLDVIRKTWEKGNMCRFVIISGYRQFEYAYNALKYKVEDYLLKPVEKTELNRVLQKICEEIRHVAPSDEDMERIRQHTYLIEKGIHQELKNDSLSLTDINRMFKAEFQKGKFRVVMMKLDFTRDEKQRMEDVSSVINKIRNVGFQILQNCCTEVIGCWRKDRVLFLLNYGAGEDEKIKKRLKDIYVHAKHVTDLFYGFNLTMCVGKSVDRICYAEESRISCHRLCWLRMHYGINQIMFEDAYEDTPVGGFRPHLNSIRGELEKSFNAMDVEAMKLQLKQFFLLPVPILCGTEAMLFLNEVIGHFCERYAMVMKDAASQESIKENIFGELDMQTSMEAYEQALSRQLERYLLEMSETVRGKNAKPILRATAYIENHFAEHITLETLANLVNLNPIYFSNLFKREVGKSFTEYLTDFRMKKAKEMLRSSDCNINEIADALGYSDARYFSKTFKKEVGIKPTDYRKIYG